MRILLVEDSRKLVESLRLGLSKEGYEVGTALDGEAGLRMTAGGSWVAVVLDMMLPGMHGLEVLEALRNDGCASHVLILTAMGSVEDRVRGLQAGADDYLVKPFSFDELLARVQALTRRRFDRKTPVIKVGDLAVDTV